MVSAVNQGLVLFLLPHELVVVRVPVVLDLVFISVFSLRVSILLF